jgi:hypothetical protein
MRSRFQSGQSKAIPLAVPLVFPTVDPSAVSVS